MPGMGIEVFRLVTIFSTVTFLFLGYFVYKKDPTSRLYQVFMLFNASVALWSLGFLLTMFASFPQWVALTFSRLSHFIGNFASPIFFYFVILFLHLENRIRIKWGHYVFIAIASVSCLTPWVVKAVVPKMFFPYYPEPGALYPLFIVTYVYYFARGLYLFFQAYRNPVTEPLRRTQIIYMLIAVMMGWVSCGTLIAVIYNIKITPILILLPLYSILTTYAIVRHRLLDIEVIVKRTLQFAGLVAAVVGVVSLVAFVSQDLLAHFIAIPKWLSNVLAAAIIAGLYGPLNAWLTNVTEKYLFQKKYDYRQLLKKFIDEVMVQLNLDQLVKMTVETLTETVKLDGCSLLLVNKDTRQYELVASKGTNGQKVVFEEHEPFITFLRETHEPIGRDGELGKVRFPSEVTDRIKQLNARLCLPMEMHDELIGVLCLGKKKSDEEFTRDDLDVLLPVAKTLGIAVSNAQLVDELKKTQAEAAQSEKLAVIGTLSAGINHEICNPLGIVKAQCEAFLLDQQDGILIGKSAQDLLDRTTTIMQVALKQIDRATAITQKLSNFAKPIKDAAAQQVSVAQEIDEVLLLVGHDLELGKIEVVKEMDPNLPPIIADRRQLQEVLFNLIRNAGQAIKPPGTITVRAYTSGGDLVRVEIEDTGSGIAPDKLGKIYDPFFTTKEPGKGTGLGLFIVRQIVERNKGRISVESTVGKGTIFFLEFPMAKTVPVAA